MRWFTIAVALSLMAALAISGTVLAGNEPPMKGRFTITLDPDTAPRCGANALTLGFDGVGIATHMGRITGVASNCTEFGLFTGAVPIYDGRATFTAADGSTITTAYEGGQGAPTAGVAAVQTSHTVVSGTGRFEDAAGTWTLSGLIDFAAGSSTGTLSGWLSY